MTSRIYLTLVISILLGGCSAGAPMGIVISNPVHAEEAVATGVVTGLWRYDHDENAQRLQGHFVGLDSDDALAQAHHYQVRVGIDRSYWISRSVEIATLPEGWTYSLEDVVNDGRTINVGDVVEVRVPAGSRLAAVHTIVRKCNEWPAESENRDWFIRCIRVRSFNRRGYGGEVYLWSGF